MSCKKDPACLFFISDWLVATKEMKAECRGWYLNLILHQYDKGSLPNDIEELANMADVRVSEFDKFKQVFEQVLKQKFDLNESGRLENGIAKKILQSRELFKEKRSAAGKLSYFLKFCRLKGAKEKEIEFIKANIDIESIQTKNEQVLKQVFEQTLELYRNVNENRNVYKEEDKGDSVKGDFDPIEEFTKSPAWDEWFCMTKKEQPHVLEYAKNNFSSDKSLSGTLQGKSLPQIREYFLNWYVTTFQERLKKNPIKPPPPKKSSTGYPSKYHDTTDHISNRLTLNFLDKVFGADHSANVQALYLNDKLMMESLSKSEDPLPILIDFAAKNNFQTIPSWAK